MSLPSSAGLRFRKALEEECPLQVAGTVNAYCALLAERAGFRAIYLSGAGVANASHGIADLGLTSLNDVLEDVRRITAVTELPLLVDADTGWGGALMISRTVREMIRAGAAGLHLEDQVQEKRCGHRPGKQLVEADEMVDRVKAAVDARTDSHFIIMARTDAYAVEGLDAAIERSQKNIDAGADHDFRGSAGESRSVWTVYIGSLRTGFGKSDGIRKDADLQSRGAEGHGCQDGALPTFGLSGDERRGEDGIREYSGRGDAKGGAQSHADSRGTLRGLKLPCPRKKVGQSIWRGKDTQMSAKKMVQLSGINAGSTEIATVGREGKGLTYRGYNIEDLAEHSTFEEVAYLLLKNSLPDKESLERFRAELRDNRALPEGLKKILEELPAHSHPMDVPPNRLFSARLSRAGISGE